MKSPNILLNMGGAKKADIGLGRKLKENGTVAGDLYPLFQILISNQFRFTRNGELCHLEPTQPLLMD
jgi:hypothetical protein